MKRKIILIIICVLLALLFIKYKNFFKYFSEQKYYSRLVKYHILKKCYNSDVDFDDIFAQEGLDYISQNQKTINESLDKLDNLKNTSEKTSKIPTITHKIFFASSKKTVTLSDYYLENMKVNYTNLNNLGYEWEHNIWVNQNDLITDEIKAIKGVKLRDLSELKDHPMYPVLLDLIDKGADLKAYLAQASDLFRLMLLQKFGGLYSDMDYEIYDPSYLLSLMKNFDFIGAREHWSENAYYGNAFLAAKPNHPILNEAMTRSYRNYHFNILDSSTPNYIKYPCKISDNLYFNGPPLISISYFKKNNIEGNNDIIMPPWMIFNVSFIRYKNETCDLSNISKEFIQDKNSHLESLLNQFILKPEIIKGQKNDLVRVSAQHENIFYNLKNRNHYRIVGADMFCGSWTEGASNFKKYYYWNLP